MSEADFKQPVWVGKLSRCLQELVDYERELEAALSYQRQEIEIAMGMRGRGHEGLEDRVRDRIIDEYGRIFAVTPTTERAYQQDISCRLNELLKILREHPVLKDAIYRAEDGQLSLGLNFAVSIAPGHQLIFVLEGLIDHAVEYSPHATTAALSEMIQRGEDKDLSAYWILLFRGLHVGQRQDFANGLSVVSLEEVRRYLRDDIIRGMLEASDREIGREPVGAVIFEVKWGPVVIPAEFDLDGMDWPERPETFRDDALLLLDALAVAHCLPVASYSVHRGHLHRVTVPNGLSMGSST